MDGWVVHVEREMGLKLNTNKNMGREGINEQERCSRVNVEELADGLNSIHMTIHKRGSLFTGIFTLDLCKVQSSHADWWCSGPHNSLSNSVVSFFTPLARGAH